MIIQCPDCQTRFKLDPERVPRRSIRVRCSKCRYVFPVDGSVLDPAPEASSFDAVEPRPVSAPRPAAEVDAPSPPEFDRGPLVDREPEALRPPQNAAPDGVAKGGRSGGFGLELERSEVPSLATDEPQGPTVDVDLPAATATMAPEVETRPADATPAVEAPTPVEKPAPVQAQVEAPEAARPGASPGAAEADPKLKKARRLARALVSDILVYNREVRDRALVDGTLVQALGQEIKKSWELYKEKVDPEFASESNLFREALNDILADGQKIF